MRKLKLQTKNQDSPKTLKFKSLRLFSRREQSGFTLIELLLVIAIMLALAVAAAPLYGNLHLSTQLNENIAQIIQTTRIARERSFSRLNNFPHGVYFEINPAGNDKFILYQGNSYATRDTDYDREVSLDSSLSLSTTLPGNEVYFSKGFGIPDATGTVTLTHNVKGARIMRINDFGMVEEK